ISDFTEQGLLNRSVVTTCLDTPRAKQLFDRRFSMNLQFRIAAVAVSLFLFLAGEAHAESINVALQTNGGTATAISEGTYMGISHPASFAIDDDYDTSWTSHWSMPAWIQVEFDDLYEIGRVATGVNYHQQTFAISLSSDGSEWSTVVPPTLSSNVPDQIPSIGSAGPAYEIFDIEPQWAQFMRVDFTSTTAPSGHIFKAIAGEVEAYAVPEPATLSLLMMGSIVGGMALLRRRREA
ncbi:MAG: discoidin domain-containing protein, partial [Planctomycetales bacterium]